MESMVTIFGCCRRYCYFCCWSSTVVKEELLLAATPFLSPVFQPFPNLSFSSSAPMPQVRASRLFVQQKEEAQKRVLKKREEAGVPCNSSRRSQSSFEPAKQRVSANSQLPEKSKRKSKLRRLIDRLQNSYHNLREAVRQSDLQFADLFTGNQMLMHVTAAPVSRRRGRKAMKHSPSVWHWASSTTTSKV
jgi:hypothetical protein